MSSNENIKNSKSRYLRLSTEDKRESSSSNGRFTIDLLTSGGILDNVKGFIIHSIECPNVFDNVPTWANTLSLVKQTGLVSYDVVIPNSYYYIDDLITELNTQINLVTPDVVTITKVGIAPVEKLQFGVVGDDYEFKLSSTIASKLGITADFIVTDGSSVIAQAIPNLIGETAVYVHSRDLTPNNLIEGSGSFSVIDKLNLDKPYGATCYSSLDDPVSHLHKYFPYETLKTMRSITIVLRNSQGNVLIIPDNFNFTMMMTIFYK